MRVEVEAFGHVLSFTLSLDCIEYEEEQVVEVEVDHGGRLDAHLAFGFAPDPVFPDLIWEEEEGRCKP
jgi:hypothetical protein